MSLKLKKISSHDEQNTKRTNRIISKLNLKKLPFKITEEQFCSSYTEMFKELTPLFRYQPHEYAMKWCLSSEKRMRVFFLVFEDKKKILSNFLTKRSRQSLLVSS